MHSQSTGENRMEEKSKSPKDDQFINRVDNNNSENMVLQFDNNMNNVNGTNLSKETPLHCAMDKKDVSKVKRLLANGADVNLVSYCKTFCTYETPIVTAVRLRHDEFVDMMLCRDCDLNRPSGSQFKEGKTALHWTATYGNIILAEKLLKHGANINLTDAYEHNALHYAVIGEQAEMTKWLLDHGSEINLNSDDRSPLHIAASRGYSDIVEMLLKQNCDLDISDVYNNTPLTLACSGNHIGIVKNILEHSHGRTNLDLNSGLHKASEKGYNTIIKYLLQKGADINSINQLGETALALAAEDHYQTMLLLMENGAKLNIIDKHGYMPLQLALMRDQSDTASVLISRGAVLVSYSPVIKSPLQLAFSMSNAMIVKYILQVGCRYENEAWFNQQLVREKIQEEELNVPCGSQLYRDKQKEIWEWIYKICEHPASLKENARTAIREQLVLATDGASVLPNIDQLPVPRDIKEYLTLPEIICRQ